MAGIYASLDRITGPGCNTSKEKDAGRARLDRVEGRDSWRTGPSRTTVTMQDVLLGANGTLIPIMGVMISDR